jgi:heme/copper-type cytochrome/quinol oxidase subunit 2
MLSTGTHKRLRASSALLVTSNLWAFPRYNMPQVVTPIGHDISDVRMTIFYLCVMIAALVFGVMIYTMIKHRQSTAHTTAPFHKHVGTEIAWTIAPLLIFLAMAWPATKVLMSMNDGNKRGVNIKIEGNGIMIKNQQPSSPPNIKPGETMIVKKYEGKAGGLVQANTIQKQSNSKKHNIGEAN